MAELRPISENVQAPIGIWDRGAASPKAVPQSGGMGPLWRSLLSPRRGQRALEVGVNGADLFGSLREAGVRLDRYPARFAPEGAAGFDLVLDDRTGGRNPIGSEQLQALLAPGGRWVVVLERQRGVGLADRSILRQARRAGFDRVESFFAYPSLRAPRILVPLDTPGPFEYFLHLAIGVRAPRQRFRALVARCLLALRLHRVLLTNLIVVAKRGK